MESLTTQLLQAPTLQNMNVKEPMESFVTISTRGRGGHNARGGHCSRGVLKACTTSVGHLQENCFSLHGFPDKAANISKREAPEPKFSDEEY